MIAYLKGEVVEIEEEKLILECGDIGYNISMPASALDGILRPGQEVKIHTHLHVREDAMQLYGFLTRDDLKMFRMLLGVSGIGPKAALGILSGLSADELRFAVLSDDIKTISRAPGVGKKTAQKMILELKDKLDLQEAFDTKTMHVQEASQAETGDLVDAKKEAVQALTALGYSGSEALRAVKQVDVSPDMNVEEILKQALKKMNF
ncbi:Holliday junction branch migration protein RuvA [Blautia producta]|uniref:Holliday junction branch migration protein RuvA n=1 Tax=Blautia producta TaxID=33035 RepID=UPI0031B5B1C9